MQIIVPMAILLIVYDLLNYSMTALISFPFQVIVGFALVGVYNYFKIKTQTKEKARKAEAERVEKLRKEQQAKQHAENSQRNSKVKQERH